MILAKRYDSGKILLSFLPNFFIVVLENLLIIYLHNVRSIIIHT